ncbi:MAG: UbiA family prenyltransferase [Granulosicoccaceae bacterium]
MFTTLLKLGRVSNLPTVWSNTLAGAVLAGVYIFNESIPLLLIAMSLAYIGGMFLNDAYDSKIDALERPERPIPSGKISNAAVYYLGYGMLAASICLVMVSASRALGIPQYAAASALALCSCIMLYNIWHKNNPISPLIMGMCRMFVYITAGYTLMREPSSLVMAAAVVTLSYLIGLTYIAKSENNDSFAAMWPIAFLAVPLGFGIMRSADSIPTLLFTLLFGGWLLYSLQFLLNPDKRNVSKAVVSMIAGISLLDAIYISTAGFTNLAIVAVGAFLLTLFLQRYIAGT